METHNLERSPRSPAVTIAFWTAILACLPYLTLKLIWISGGELGIPPGSELLSHAMTMKVVNGVTVVMDSAVIGLAFVLSGRAWRTIPSWLLAGPVWVATGLLGPIALGFPAELLMSQVPGPASSSGNEVDSFLHPWVFTVVYTGFCLQALALGTLFICHARRHWGRLWAGRVGDVAVSPFGFARRFLALAVCTLCLLPLGCHVYWAFGGTGGLNELALDGPGRERMFRMALEIPFLLATAAGVTMLAFDLGRSVGARVPLALAWVGSADLFAWSGWTFFTGPFGNDVDSTPTTLMSAETTFTFAAGLLTLLGGVHFFLERRQVVGAGSSGATTVGPHAAADPDAAAR